MNKYFFTVLFAYFFNSILSMEIEKNIHNEFTKKMQTYANDFLDNKNNQFNPQVIESFKKQISQRTKQNEVNPLDLLYIATLSDEEKFNNKDSINKIIVNACEQLDKNQNINTNIANDNTYDASSKKMHNMVQKEIPLYNPEKDIIEFTDAQNNLMHGITINAQGEKLRIVPVTDTHGTSTWINSLLIPEIKKGLSGDKIAFIHTGDCFDFKEMCKHLLEKALQDNNNDISKYNIILGSILSVATPLILSHYILPIKCILLSGNHEQKDYNNRDTRKNEYKIINNEKSDTLLKNINNITQSLPSYVNIFTEKNKFITFTHAATPFESWGIGNYALMEKLLHNGKTLKDIYEEIIKKINPENIFVVNTIQNIFFKDTTKKIIQFSPETFYWNSIQIDTTKKSQHYSSNETRDNDFYLFNIAKEITLNNKQFCCAHIMGHDHMPDNLWTIMNENSLESLKRTCIIGKEFLTKYTINKGNGTLISLEENCSIMFKNFKNNRLCAINPNNIAENLNTESNPIGSLSFIMPYLLKPLVQKINVADTENKKLLEKIETFLQTYENYFFISEYKKKPENKIPNFELTEDQKNKFDEYITSEKFTQAFPYQQLNETTMFDFPNLMLDNTKAQYLNNVFDNLITLIKIINPASNKIEKLKDKKKALLDEYNTLTTKKKTFSQKINNLSLTQVPLFFSKEEHLQLKNEFEMLFNEEKNFFNNINTFFTTEKNTVKDQLDNYNLSIFDEAKIKEFKKEIKRGILNSLEKIKKTKDHIKCFFTLQEINSLLSDQKKNTKATFLDSKSPLSMSKMLLEKLLFYKLTKWNNNI